MRVRKTAPTHTIVKLKFDTKNQQQKEKRVKKVMSFSGGGRRFSSYTYDEHQKQRNRRAKQRENKRITPPEETITAGEDNYVEKNDW